MIEYPQITVLPEDYVKSKVQSFIEEDLPKGDYTSGGIFSDSTSFSSAYIQAEEDLIVAGSNCVKHFFGDNCKTEIIKNDGQFCKNGELIAKISGPSGLILSRERILLNLIQRLSGIATMTKKFTVIADPYNVKVLDTRKTTPGLRLFEKWAVSVGGGYNHRLDLSSGILIKDNHIKAAGSISNAVSKIKLKNYNLPVEVEVENFEQITEALDAGVDGLLLDNMSPATLKEAVEFIRKFSVGEDIFIEASGGINLQNLSDYVQTGVNAISSGALSHSVKGANIHMEFE